MALVRQLCVWWSLSALLFMQLLIFYVAAEIRCYCNLPSCVSTGYMCKSSAGMCFSEISSSYSGQGRRNHHHYNRHHRVHHRYRNLMPDLTQSRHGCVESIKSQHKVNKCKLSSYRSNESKSNSPLSMYGDSNIACCQRDMCNYVDSLDIKIQISTQSNLSHPQDKSVRNQKKSRNDKKYNDTIPQDLWFKAAVIAVPIAGGFILIFLIFLAVRMLKKDASYQKRVKHMHNQQQRRCNSKLMFPPRYCDSNNLNAKLDKNFPNRQASLYSDVNIPMKTDECSVDMKTTAGFSNSECNAESDTLLLDSVASWNYLNAKNNSSPI